MAKAEAVSRQTITQAIMGRGRYRIARTKCCAKDWAVLIDSSQDPPMKVAGGPMAYLAKVLAARQAETTLTKGREHG